MYSSFDNPCEIVNCSGINKKYKYYYYLKELIDKFLELCEVRNFFYKVHMSDILNENIKFEK